MATADRFSGSLAKAQHLLADAQRKRFEGSSKALLAAAGIFDSNAAITKMIERPEYVGSPAFSVHGDSVGLAREASKKTFRDQITPALLPALDRSQKMLADIEKFRGLSNSPAFATATSLQRNHPLWARISRPATSAQATVSDRLARSMESIRRINGSRTVAEQIRDSQRESALNLIKTVESFNSTRRVPELTNWRVKPPIWKPQDSTPLSSPFRDPKPVAVRSPVEAQGPSNELIAPDLDVELVEELEWYWEAEHPERRRLRNLPADLRRDPKNLNAAGVQVAQVLPTLFLPQDWGIVLAITITLWHFSGWLTKEGYIRSDPRNHF